MKHRALVIASAAPFCCHVAAAALVTFDEISVPGVGFQNDFGGQFQIGSASFLNNTDADLETWSGFAVSNITDTSPDGLNREFSAISSGGTGGTGNYAVGLYSSSEFATTHVRFDSLTSMVGRGAYITNTTWAYYDMLLEGGDFSPRKFGGATGDDPDWFKLVIEGFGETDEFTGLVEFYLADFRDEDNYIVQNWRFVDFSNLGNNVTRIEFSLSSSDAGTPLYFAMDDFMAVPEPSSLLASVAGLGLLLRRKR